MRFLQRINALLETHHLLKNSFDQAWSKGELGMASLQYYSKEHYHLVSAFPRESSQTHGVCSQIEARKILLKNLVDEEQGKENHLELWMRFSEGLSFSRKDVRAPEKLPTTNALVDGYYNLVKTDYVTGLGILSAYERQTPKASEAKIHERQKFYGEEGERTLSFFFVHSKFDVWHTEKLVGLIHKFLESEQRIVKEGAEKGAHLLWQFLDGMMH